MNRNDLQSLCALGQQQLMAMDYLAAEATLLEAERLAMAIDDFDTLARLYMPLQESRRLRRQRCGEGIVRLDLVARGPDDRLDADDVVRGHPHGQLLVAGWGSIEPALRVRQLASECRLYLETFLGVVDPQRAGQVVVVPLAYPGDAHRIVLNIPDLPAGAQRGNADTFAHTMSLWERLHAPFLADADREVDPVRRIEAYRQTTRVDYACELAHQKLADVAHQLARTRAASLPAT